MAHKKIAPIRTREDGQSQERNNARGCLKSRPPVGSVQYPRGMNASPYPTDLTCKLPTFIHLGGRRSHNAVHGCEVTEMLKTPPQDFRAGVISATASDNTAPL